MNMAIRVPRLTSASMALMSERSTITSATVHVGELEHVLQDRAFALGEIAGFAGGGFVERFLEIIAQRGRTQAHKAP